MILLLPLSSVNAVDFKLSVSPIHAELRAGEVAHFTVILETLNPSFSNDIYLASLFEPSAVSITFSDNPLNPSRATYSIMTVRTSVQTPPGIYTITVRGRDPTTDQRVYVDITLEVLPPYEPSFELSISPSSLTVTRGEKAVYTVKATLLYGFHGSIYLSLLCPSCVSHAFSPNPMCPAASTCSCPAISCYTSNLTIDTSRMELGNYSVLVEGCHGSVCDRAYATLTIKRPALEDVNLIVYPMTVRVKPGDALHERIIIGIPGGESPEPLKLKIHAPSGWYVSYYPNSVSRTSYLDLWITVPREAYLGTYGVSIELYRGEDLLKGREITVLVERGRGQLTLTVKPSKVVLTPTDPSSEIAVFLKSTEDRKAKLMLLGLPSGISYVIPPELEVGDLGVINLTLMGAGEGEYNATLIAEGDCFDCLVTTSITVEVKGTDAGEGSEGGKTTTQQESETRTTVTVEKPSTVTKTVREVRTVTAIREPIDYTLLGLGIIVLSIVLGAIYLWLRSSTPAVMAGAPQAG